MQKKYEDAVGDLETKIEELNREMAYRTEYLKKESVEVQALREESNLAVQYLVE